MSAPSTTSTGAVEVTLDADRQVSGISITALPDHLRTPDGLAAALQRAYLDAIGERIEERLGAPSRPPGERPVAQAAPTPPPARSASFGHVPHEQLVEFWRRDVPAPQRPTAREVGVSANQCVQVRLHTTDHFADLDLDPGWLSTARVSAVAAAVLEAFEHAYQQRNQR